MLFSSIVTYDHQDQDSFSIHESLVTDYLTALSKGGIGIFIHNGVDCERFLAATNLCHDYAEDKTLRPLIAEWKIISDVECGFVVVHALKKNDFLTSF